MIYFVDKEFFKVDICVGVFVDFVFGDYVFEGVCMWLVVEGYEMFFLMIRKVISLKLFSFLMVCVSVVVWLSLNRLLIFFFFFILIMEWIVVESRLE